MAFRRAFLTFEAVDEKGNVVWASGRTNSVGAIVKGTGEEVLPTELFFDPATRKQVFQPHHQTINDESQAQIYEEIIADPQGKITTSFVGLDHALKNNRFLPKGWRTDGPLAEFTSPHGDAEHDPDYNGKSGATGADNLTYRIPLEQRTRASWRARHTQLSIDSALLLKQHSRWDAVLRRRDSLPRKPSHREGTPVSRWAIRTAAVARATNCRILLSRTFCAKPTSF